MTFSILLACTAIGAVVGVFYARSQTAASAERSLEIIRSTQIDESNRSQRLQRAEAIGHTMGLRIGALIFVGALGAAAGLFVGLATVAVMWIAG